MTRYDGDAVAVAGSVIEAATRAGFSEIRARSMVKLGGFWAGLETPVPVATAVDETDPAISELAAVQEQAEVVLGEVQPNSQVATYLHRALLILAPLGEDLPFHALATTGSAHSYVNKEGCRELTTDMKNALKLLGLSHAQNRTILSRDSWWSARPLLFFLAKPFTDTYDLL